MPAPSICTSNGVHVTWSSTCTRSEYGDPFSIMGTGTNHLSAWNLAQIGWLPDTRTITSSGFYSISPTELAGQPRLMRLARGDGTFLYFDFRQPFGAFDTFAHDRCRGERRDDPNCPRSADSDSVALARHEAVDDGIRRCPADVGKVVHRPDVRYHDHHDVRVVERCDDQRSVAGDDPAFAEFDRNSITNPDANSVRRAPRYLRRPVQQCRHHPARAPAQSQRPPTSPAPSPTPILHHRRPPANDELTAPTNVKAVRLERRKVKITWAASIGSVAGYKVFCNGVRLGKNDVAALLRLGAGRRNPCALRRPSLRSVGPARPALGVLSR